MKVNTMSEIKVKTVSGLKGSVATFVRPDGNRIYVFPKRGESTDNAIARVKKRNGALGVEHQLVSN
jgi:adenine deaminase